MLKVLISFLCALTFQSCLSDGPVKRRKYTKNVIFSTETDFQKIEVTEWKGDRWFFSNGKVQFSTLDYWLYYEPLVHPVAQLSSSLKNVLIVGGENGLAAAELMKYPEVEKIDLLPVDRGLYQTSKKERFFSEVNQNVLSDSRINHILINAQDFLSEINGKYDLIILDIPDPFNARINFLYTQEFYGLCFHALTNEGLIITQAVSPYLTSKAFSIINNTLRAAEFQTLPIHNQVLSAGQWGWIIASKDLQGTNIKQKMKELTFEHIRTKWLNKEAIKMISSFGKPIEFIDSSIVNTKSDPVLLETYERGTWAMN